MAGISICFGGAAAVAPIVYAALAKTPGVAGAEAGAIGSRLGLSLAAVITLFAIFGELATIGTLTSKVPGKGTLLTVAVVIAWLAVVVYSVRSLLLMANGQHSSSTGSLLSQPGKSSATL